MASYPKSGNTWLRIFLENLLTDASTPVDINRLCRVTHAAARRLFDGLTDVESSDLTPEEILVRRRQRETDYQFDLNLGFSYRFGSKFANIVNPRMSRGDHH